MRPSDITTALETLTAIRQPAFLWGAPGVGKSQIVAQLARKLDIELLDVRAVLLDPVDLRGLPRIDGERAQWCPPAFLPTSGEGILFLDELNAAPPLVQAACYQLILDRKVGEYELPDGWTVVAAGNRESDRAVTHRMPSALANRMVHLHFDADLDDWLAWATASGIPSLLRAFLRFRPRLLHDFDPQRSEKAFPSPRTWEVVARIMDAAPSEAVMHSMVAGAVGDGAATELSAYLQVCENLPDAAQVLANPDFTPVPEDPATLYALCESLASAASGDTMPDMTRYAMRMPAEFGVLLMREAAKNDRGIVHTAAFADWARANSEVLV